MKIAILNKEQNIPEGDIKDDDGNLLGRMECQLGHIVGARKSTFSKDLLRANGSKAGTVTIVSEELAEGARVNDTLALTMEGQTLAAKNWGGLGSSDPYLIFKKLMPDNSFAKMYETEVTRIGHSESGVGYCRKVKRIAF